MNPGFSPPYQVTPNGEKFLRRSSDIFFSPEQATMGKAVVTRVTKTRQRPSKDMLHFPKDRLKNEVSTKASLVGWHQPCDHIVPPCNYPEWDSFQQKTSSLGPRTLSLSPQVAASPRGSGPGAGSREGHSEEQTLFPQGLSR